MPQQALNLHPFISLPLVEKALASSTENEKRSNTSTTHNNQTPSFHYLWVNHIGNDGGHPPQLKERKNQAIEAPSAKHKSRRRLKRQS